MANVDYPNGFVPYGGPQLLFTFLVKTGETIARGDFVSLDGNGEVVLSTAASATLLGVADETVSAAAAGTRIPVYAGDGQVYVGQCSGTVTQAMLGKECDLEGASGVQEVNENAVLTQVLRIVGFQPDTTIGSANARVFVQNAKPSLGNVEGDFDTLSVQGAALIGGTLGVSGAATFGSTGEFTGLLTALMGLTDGTATLDGSGNWTGVGNIGMTGDITGGANGIFSASLVAPTVVASDAKLEVAGQPSPSRSNGTMAHRVIKATYDFTIHGGGAGQIPIGLDGPGTGTESVVIPAGSLIKKTYVWIETAFTSGGLATVSFDCAAPDDIIVAKAFDHADYTVATCSEGIQDGTPALMEILAGTLAITVGTADLTGGRVHLFVEYMTAL